MTQDIENVDELRKQIEDLKKQLEEHKKQLARYAHTLNACLSSIKAVAE